MEVRKDQVWERTKGKKVGQRAAVWWCDEQEAVILLHGTKTFTGNRQVTVSCKTLKEKWRLVIEPTHR